MQQIVSITSQGQITIPASIRRLLRLDKYNKATVRTEDKKIIVEPVPDILRMGGLLQKRAIKGKAINEILKQEEKAVSRTVTKRYKK